MSQKLTLVAIGADREYKCGAGQRVRGEHCLGKIKEFFPSRCICLVDAARLQLQHVQYSKVLYSTVSSLWESAILQVLKG